MNPKTLSKKQRLERQIRGDEIDQIPTIGGWVGGVRNVSAIAGITIEEYLQDPYRSVVQAHKALDVDGMIQPAYHIEVDQIRTGHVLESDFSGIEPDAIKAYADSLPDSEKEVLAEFDYEAEEKYYREYFLRARKEWGDIEPIPNFWEIGGHFPLYNQFGYSAFLMACIDFPESVGKIWWVRSLCSRERAKILLPLYEEFSLVPLMFCGEDLCNNSGPMVSPKFLRQYYLPTVKMIIQPLVDEGIRLIHHCDGDVRPLLNDYLETGFSGLQGFQYELGIDLAELDQLRSKDGRKLLYFTGMSVSRTLPLGSVEDVEAEVQSFIDALNGGERMFLFTSNVTGVEVPVENILAGYRYVKKIKS